jgi:YbgC/YbaW family acyl-CoA thioester hydrolase
MAYFLQHLSFAITYMKTQNHTPQHLNTLDFPIRWVDMDAYRHVAQTRYLDAMTETRATWLRHALQDDALNKCHYYVAETSCRFYKAFKYPGIMRVKQYLVSLERSQFTLEYQFYSSEEDKLYALGVARMVCVDPVTERPVRVPEALHAFAL